jgi:hypothetical protein
MASSVQSLCAAVGALAGGILVLKMELRSANEKNLLDDSSAKYAFWQSGLTAKTAQSAIPGAHCSDCTTTHAESHAFRVKIRTANRQPPTANHPDASPAKEGSIYPPSGCIALRTDPTGPKPAVMKRFPAG